MARHAASAAAAMAAAAAAAAGGRSVVVGNQAADGGTDRAAHTHAHAHAHTQASEPLFASLPDGVSILDTGLAYKTALDLYLQRAVGPADVDGEVVDGAALAPLSDAEFAEVLAEAKGQHARRAQALALAQGQGQGAGAGAGPGGAGAEAGPRAGQTRGRAGRGRRGATLHAVRAHGRGAAGHVLPLQVAAGPRAHARRRRATHSLWWRSRGAQPASGRVVGPALPIPRLDGRQAGPAAAGAVAENAGAQGRAGLWPGGAATVADGGLTVRTGSRGQAGAAAAAGAGAAAADQCPGVEARRNRVTRDTRGRGVRGPQSCERTVTVGSFIKYLVYTN